MGTGSPAIRAVLHAARGQALGGVAVLPLPYVCGQSSRAVGGREDSCSRGRFGQLDGKRLDDRAALEAPQLSYKPSCNRTDCLARAPVQRIDSIGPRRRHPVSQQGSAAAAAKT